jgi:phosphate transport system protein
MTQAMNAPSAHILRQFDEDLTVLRDLVLRMGGLVENQLAGAIDSLQAGDEAAARRVIEGDREIDRIELRSDEEVARLLALRAPLGVDLRTVLTLAKTVNDLERIGDEAKKIARMSTRCIAAGQVARQLPLLDSVLAMGESARGMLHGALNALVRLDLTLADGVARDDDHLDDRFKAVYADAKALMRERPDQVDVTFEMAFVAKSLERVGDHAKNIANYVFYLVEGRDVRHPSVNRS